MNTGAISADGLTPEVIDSVRTNLDKILASEPFIGSDRLRRFLRFIVERTLSGQSEQIKEYVVALEVFDKDGSFDPRVDPIVRVEAGRLRSKLREYYEVDGQADLMRIELPKGSYVPVFHLQKGRALVGEKGEASRQPQPLSPPSVRTDSSSGLSGSGSDAQSTMLAEPKQRHWFPSTAIIVGVALLAAAFGYWISQRRVIETADAPRVVPFTTFPGHEQEASFSPDGKQVAFVWIGEKQYNGDIYVKQIGSNDPRQLTKDPQSDHSPAWSPDGQSIAFVRELAPGKAAVMITPVNGGRERQVAELRTENVPGIRRWLSWHPGGRWLAIPSDVEVAGAPAALYLLSPETGERRRLTFPPRGSNAAARPFGDNMPAFSPEGRSLVFVRYFGRGGPSEIYLLRLTDGLVPDGEPRQLTFANRFTVTPGWFPDGKSIIYASGSYIHSARLWQLSIFGPSEPKPVSVTGQGIAVDPAISGTTRRLVYRSISWDINIWRNQIVRENEKPVPPFKLVASSATEEGVQYSPDGKSVAFTSYASGASEIWVSDSNGSNAFPLTHLDGPMHSFPRWSPNGGEITFSVHSNGNAELYVVTSQSGQTRQLTQTPFDEDNPSYSHDGRWIYFDSTRSGRAEIWKMPVEGGAAVRVTQKGGKNPQESVDGKALFYLSGSEHSDSSELWKIPTEGGEETQVIKGVLYTNFEVKQRGVYYAAQPAGGETQFFFHDFATEKPTRIATIQNRVQYGFSVSPDEKWILSTQSPGTGGSDLVLVENFQ